MNSEACAEIDFIISNMLPEDLSKIPLEYINLFKEYKSKNYTVTLNFDKPLYEQKLLEDTKIYLAAIYRNFLCTDEEKLQYKEQNDSEIFNNQNISTEPFQDEIFSHKKISNINKVNNSKNLNNDLIVYKKNNIFTIIINKIKNFFGGNHEIYR